MALLWRADMGLLPEVCFSWFPVHKGWARHSCVFTVVFLCFVLLLSSFYVPVFCIPLLRLDRPTAAPRGEQKIWREGGKEEKEEERTSRDLRL